ncbi:MAG TPA: hypothetical protein VLS91_05110 [Acidimicrobiales bacterium]|nr:hypothetical protein [Acidimicrobiales bacterium]
MSDSLARPRPAAMRRVAVIASASGNGKTTLARELARRIGVEAIELDALVHGPHWIETPDDVLRATLEPLLAHEKWVCDGTYRNKLGDLVLEAADTVVWLDQSIQVWLPRLVSRTFRRIRHRETLWNGNHETIRGAIGARDALIPYALRMHFRRRRTWPHELAPWPVVRLRTPSEIDSFLASVPGAAASA